MGKRIKVRREAESFFGGALWFAVCPDGRDLTPDTCTYTVHNTHPQAITWASEHIAEVHS